MQFAITCYEVKKSGENHWQEVSEKMVLDKLADNFNQITPVLTKMLQGNEVVAEKEIFRVKP
jgi:hypothetical protein